MRPKVLIATLIALAGCGEPEVDPLLCINTRGNTLEAFDDLRYIAHGGGSPGGLLQTEVYSNSREAFEVSYANGFRAFEFDLVTLGDGTVVVAHDGHEYRYGVDKDFWDATRADFEGRRWHGRYDILFVEDLVDLLRDYPDVWIVLDNKWEEIEIAAAIVAAADSDPAVLDRVVPHMVSEDHTRAVEDIYPFPQRMVAVYQWAGGDAYLIQQMQRFGIEHVMMWYDKRWSEHTQAAFEQAGLQMWVHTPHEPDAIDDFLGRGINIYSDGHIGGCDDVRRASAGE